MPKVHSNSSALKCVFISGFVLLFTQISIAHAAPAVMPSPEVRDKKRQAIALFHQSQWNQAIPLYSEVLKTQPNDVKARVDRGVCYCRVGEYQKALDDFNISIKTDPKSGRAFQHRGWVYYRLGKYANTVADSSKAIALSESNRFAYRDRARAYAKLGKLDLAQKDMEVQKNLYGVARDYYAALDMEHKGQFTGALDIFRNNLKQNPGAFNPNYHRATIYSKLGMYEEAIKVCTQFIKDHPTTVEGRRLRAINYLQVGELDKAIADADSALKANPELTDPYYVKARAATYKKNYAEAIKNYSTIIELQPAKELPARMERADTYSAMGEYDKAIADYDFLARVEQKDEAVFHHRAGVYLKMHAYDKAIADLQKFVQLSPKDSLSLMSLGDGLSQAHRYPEAVKAYTKAIELDATSPTLFEHRALAFENCKDSEGAKKDRLQARLLRESD